MHRALLAACLVVAVTFTSTAGGSPIGKIGPLGAGLDVTASPATAGARNVKLIVAMRYPMQCGYPGAGPLVVTLPASEVVPVAFPSGSILLDGRPTPARVSGPRITLTIPPHDGVMCDVIGPGVLVVTFTPHAGIGNPAEPGRYHVTASHGPRSLSAVLTVA